MSFLTQLDPGCAPRLEKLIQQHLAGGASLKVRRRAAEEWSEGLDKCMCTGPSAGGGSKSRRVCLCSPCGHLSCQQLGQLA